MSHVEVAQTIQKQLGGGRFVTMTGAKNLAAHAAEKGTRGALSFTLPSRFAKDGINYVKVTLTGRDTYDIEFIKIGPRPSLKQMMAGKEQTITTVKKLEDIYADQLPTVFSRVTGLDHRL
jgi:hypothetical protein